MLDTNSGRWMQQDPIGFDAEDPNLYRYVGNNPTNATDPSGLQEKRLTVADFQLPLDRLILRLGQRSGEEMPLDLSEARIIVPELAKTIQFLPSIVGDEIAGAQKVGQLGVLPAAGFHLGIPLGIVAVDVLTDQLIDLPRSLFSLASLGLPNTKQASALALADYVLERLRMSVAPPDNLLEVLPWGPSGVGIMMTGSDEFDIRELGSGLLSNLAKMSRPSLLPLYYAANLAPDAEIRRRTSDILDTHPATRGEDANGLNVCLGVLLGLAADAPTFTARINQGVGRDWLNNYRPPIVNTVIRLLKTPEATQEDAVKEEIKQRLAFGR